MRFVEGSMDPWVCCFVDPEFVVSAADVLDERMPGTDHAGAAEIFETAHRTEPKLESAVIGFNPIVGVALGVVSGTQDALLEDRRVDRCLVGDDLSRGRPVLKCTSEEIVGCRQGPLRGKPTPRSPAQLVDRPVHTPTVRRP